MQAIVAAINQYNAEYSRYPNPDSPAKRYTADTTFGLSKIEPNKIPNSDLMVVLLNIEQGPNAANAKNPRKIPFLNAQRNTGTDVSGLGSDWEYRDPWRNPYKISIDYNYDDKTADAVYQKPAVSEVVGSDPLKNAGLNGLTKNGSIYIFNGPVMIWSAGPDGDYDDTVTSNKKAKNVNSDNVLSWTQ
jgi:hypothetical protein